MSALGNAWDYIKTKLGKKTAASILAVIDNYVGTGVSAAIDTAITADKIYGSLYTDQADGLITTINTVNVFEPIIGLQIGQAVGVTSDATKITIVTTGIYRVSFTGNGAGSANTLYTIRLAINGAEVNKNGASTSVFSGTGSAIGTGSFSSLYGLTAGQEISLLVRNEGGSANWNFRSCSFVVEKM